MEEIKPKKEKRFLKAVGKVAGILIQEFVLGLGRKFIGKKLDKIGNKRQALLIFLALFCNIAFASVDSIPYPITGNKQRLGWQTTGNGLVYRGRASDTITKPSNYTNKDIKAYLLVDTVNNVMYSYIASKGGWKFNNSDTIIINNNFTQPVDSLFFKTSVPTNNVDTAKMRWDSDLGTVVLGMYDQVPNELGFKNFWLVKNQTGSTITKGSIVYANGTVGASGRITVAKFIANGTIEAKYLLGVTAHDLTDGENGYVISFGKIRQVNTDTFAAGSILYPSPTVAGVWTDVEPVAPNIDMPIGFCINSNANNGTIAIRVASGYKLSELHDVSITSPVEKASLYYSNGLWRDTTSALLVSDTASMLTNYLRTGVAANTYLPLTGGTLTGGLTGTTANFSGNVGIGTTTPQKPLEVIGNINDYVSVGTRTLAPYNFTGIHFGYRENNSSFRKSAIVFQRNDTELGGGDASGKIHFLNVNFGNASQSATLADAKLTISNTGRIGIKDTTPTYDLSVNGTLGVTGQTTLSNLAGTGTRMVVAGSGGLLSTQAIPTGTVTSVGGTGSVNGITLSGTVTSSGNLTLGGTLSGVSLSSQVTGTLPIANGGTGATSAANARTNLGATTRGANTFLLTDIGVISFLRYNADNTVSQRAADGMRSDLGGTTIGQSMFTLTNPSAITFPRFNADNTVSALDATTFRTAIGAGTGNGNGTVTNVTGTLPISVANGTTTPSITIANASTTASGVITTGTQSMAGNKTFTGDLATSGAFSATGFSTLTGGASVGTMATTSTLTHILGVNSSNAIGEVALGNLSLSSGTLNVNVSDGIKTSSGAVALDMFRTITVGTDFPNTSAQSSSDITVTVTGAVAGQPVWLGVPNSAVSANTSYSAWVSAANTVTIRFNNYSSGSVNPSSGSFYVVVINL